MNNTTNNDINMQKYYEFRKAIRENLYSNKSLLDDLCCRILEIRDKYRYVESISIAIQEYSIEVELTEGTDFDKMDNIINKIGSAIGTFLFNSSHLLPDDIRFDKEFESFIDSDNFVFCDIYSVGSTIKFNL